MKDTDKISSYRVLFHDILLQLSENMIYTDYLLIHLT